MLKKLYNNVDTLVEESQEGHRLMYPESGDIKIVNGTRLIVRQPKDKKPKGLVKIAGGYGSGHEGPGAGGVRPGGSDLGIPGEIFAAPAANKIFRGLMEINDGSPIILNVTNHTGDVLNSRLAIQMARAKGVDVHMHLIYDDIASAPKGQEKDRRAIGSVYSVMGTMAEWGESVEDILRVAEKINTYTRSYGVGLRSAIHPVSGLPIMEMPEDEIELGIGVHGESSGNRIKLPRSRELAKIMCDALLEDMDAQPGEELAISVRGLGGMTWTEIYIFFKDVYEYLQERQIRIYSTSSGNSGTQELGGIIMAFARLDDEIKYWLNKGLPEHCYQDQTQVQAESDEEKGTEKETVLSGTPESIPENTENIKKLIAEMKAVASDLAERSEELCKLDSFVGDGDHGISIRKGFSKVLENMDLPAHSLEEVFTHCADAALDSMGGAIGPIIASLFMGFAMASTGKTELGIEDWEENFKKALEVVHNTGSAKPGERTLVDTLYAAVNAFEEGKGKPDSEIWKLVERRAYEGAQSTKDMRARKGRARYLAEKSVGYVDAGAMSMYYFIRQIALAEME